MAETLVVAGGKEPVPLPGSLCSELGAAGQLWHSPEPFLLGGTGRVSWFNNLVLLAVGLGELVF